jgi:hypothetical protein
MDMSFSPFYAVTENKFQRNREYGAPGRAAKAIFNLANPINLNAFSGANSVRTPMVTHGLISRQTWLVNRLSNV